jgi:CRISPR-associated endonuclease/helicase Cas3
VKELLKMRKKVICISTQLIEAGVDISFQCVIRSLTGLDSLLQAAGRCNRNGESKSGQVFLVKIDGAAEDLSNLTDIRVAQAAMEETLALIKPVDIFTEKAINYYYKIYFYKQQQEMGYNVKIDSISTTLIELLSENRIFGSGQRALRGEDSQVRILEQAFQTAGSHFQVIDKDNTVPVVVQYKNANQLLEKFHAKELSFSDQKQLLRDLQRYIVGISQKQCQEMKSIIRQIDLPKGEDKIFVWPAGYYSKQVGITDVPSEMEYLNF